MTVHRIYVEKKKPFAIEADTLAKDIRLFLQIPGLRSLRILNRYDVEGISVELFDSCKQTVFSEPPVDQIFNDLPCQSDFIFGVEFLPGQYDQRADSCSQCIQIVSQGERPTVRTAKFYCLDGQFTIQEKAAIKHHLINPVERREASLEPFASLEASYEEPAAVPVILGFITMNDDERNDLIPSLGLAMDQDDLRFCQSHFIKEERDPTLTELRLIDTYWSDHCRHTTFLTSIDGADIKGDDLWHSFQRYLAVRDKLGRSDTPVSLMDLATIGTRYLLHTGDLTDLDQSEEVNACTVKIDVSVDGKQEPWLLFFKNETHNHPTEIEPFGGAATCIGGAIRDPLSGRSYVYQGMRLTGASNPLADLSTTLPGKLPQRKIVTTAAAGYSSYGNQIGVATGLVDELYHPGYVAKRMEIGAVIGAAPAENVRRDVPAPGDPIILLGGRTGRDGCGGATGSSKAHDVSSQEKSGSEVQRGNAPEERKIQRLFRNKSVATLIKRCNDFGAGGVSVAVGELADGLSINLDAIPKKYEGLDGTELAISESQERMAVVVSPENLKTFLAFADEENLEATVIATVTEEPRLSMRWRGDVIVDLPRSFLDTNGAPKHIQIETPEPTLRWTLPSAPTEMDSLLSSLEGLVSSLSVCSQEGLTQHFDATVGRGTVLLPLGGLYQETPTQAMVATIPVQRGTTDTCSVMAYGFDPYLTEASPYHGSYLAVIDSVAKVVAAGGSTKDCHLTFQEYFEKPGSDPSRWGKPFTALLGALDAQLDLKIAAVGGKDSMSGSYEDLDVPPTLVSFAVTLGELDAITSPEWKKSGSRLVLLPPKTQESGLPDATDFLSNAQRIAELCQSKEAHAISALSSKGLIEHLFKNSLGNRIGVKLSSGIDLPFLFQPYHGAFLIETDEEIPGGIEIGTTISSFELVTETETIDLAHLRSIYREKLEPVFPTTPDREKDVVPESVSLPIARSSSKATPAPRKKTSRPLALIPVFPGTNCEYDTAAALTAAGADTDILVLKNLNPAHISESIKEASSRIRRAQIIVLPGGFSGGDEPDGSGKFITAFFRNPEVSESLEHFLNQQDGLLCGICNGFQALIKLGLVPFGEIRPPDSAAPTLSVNRIGRHQSLLVQTKIVSNTSPWLMNYSIGDIHTVAISHGEGRFIASIDQIQKMAAQGQITTQYVDLSGIPSMDTRYNPNGSILAVEGITSPDGRIFGKMGHSERYRTGLFQNVPGNKNQDIFSGAVAYFR